MTLKSRLPRKCVSVIFYPVNMQFVRAIGWALIRQLVYAPAILMASPVIPFLLSFLVVMATIRHYIKSEFVSIFYPLTPIGAVVVLAEFAVFVFGFCILYYSLLKWSKIVECYIGWVKRKAVRLNLYDKLIPKNYKHSHRTRLFEQRK